MPQSNRQLAAIMFTDIAGYTALMDKDEDAAFAMLERNRAIHKERITQYNGTFLKEMGDGILASFNTVSDAVYCAGDILNKSKSIVGLKLRMGVHLGEIISENNDIYGDGVNIASRIENAVKQTVQSGTRTGDIAFDLESVNTRTMADAILSRL